MTKTTTLVILATLMIHLRCASVINSSTQVIKVNSDTHKAEIIIYNNSGKLVYRGYTPAKIQLYRSTGFFKSAEYLVIIHKKGNKSKIITLKGTLATSYVLGNILLFPVLYIGFAGMIIIDPLSGAMWNLNPDAINSDLKVVKDLKSKFDDFIILKNGKTLTGRIINSDLEKYVVINTSEGPIAAFWPAINEIDMKTRK